MNSAEQIYEAAEWAALRAEQGQMDAKEFAEAFMENELSDALDAYSHAFEPMPDSDVIEEAQQLITDAFTKRLLIDVDPITHRPIFMTKTAALRRMGFLLSGVYLSEADRKLVKAAMRL